MTPERWARVTDLFDQVTLLPHGEREEWLASVDADTALIDEVRAMLASYDGDPAFLEQPIDAAGLLDGVDDDGLIGRRVGAYRLTRQVGRGGMGIVYEAHRDDRAFDLRVAVKLLPAWRAGWQTARFRVERQVLASLDHPGVARLLDAGTTDDGVPYFVMEFVDGEPIDAWCRRRHLPLAERVDLFTRVCDAVAFAHQHLVVHRDIKPANLLVTAEGQPKLLDFGIATLLPAEDGASAGTTHTGQSSFTPQFASPEQVRGERVTTASDVYSLGVLLYLLLTDHRPYELAGVPALEAMHLVCDVDPPRASSRADRRRAGALAGDLDNIVAKALRKSPADRYATVAAFADDLRAWRTGRPVSAAPASVAYLVRRFVRRNRLAVAAAAAVALAVAGGGTVAWWQARIARAEKARAEAQFNDVRALANAVVGRLYDAIAEVPGTTRARQVLVEEALTYLNRLNAQATADLTLKAELADAYQKIGSVQGNHVYGNAGDVQAAKRSYERALALRTEVLAGRPGDPLARRGLAEAEMLLADLALGENQYDEAVDRYDRSLRVLALAAEPTRDEASALLTARAHSRAGVALGWNGKADAAESRFAQALAVLEPIASAPDASPEARRALAATLFNSGDVHYYAERYGEALRRFETALDMARRVPADGAETTARSNVRLAAIRTAAAAKEVGRVDEAARLEAEVIRELVALTRLDPADVSLQFDLATTRQNLAITHLKQRAFGAAREAARSSLNGFEDAFRRSPDSEQWRFDFGATWVTLGQIELADGAWPRAAEAFQRALDVFRDPAVGGRMPTMPLQAHEGLGDALTALGRRSGDAALASAGADAYAAAQAGFAALRARQALPASLEKRSADVEQKLARARAGGRRALSAR